MNRTEDLKFWVTKANSVKSKLFSPSDIQRIMKKAMVERMKQSYKKEWFPEDGAPFLIRVSIMKDEVTVGLDTSGESVKPCEKVRFCHYEPAVRRASGGEKGSAWPVSGVRKGLCGIR